MIETSASAMITGEAQRLASGNSSRQNRIMPKVPILSRMPTISVEPPGVPCSAASGSQVWKGTIGAFSAKAMKKPRNSQRPTLPPRSSWVSSLSR